MKPEALRYSICVSGAAAGDTVSKDVQVAADLGAAIARQGHVVTTGATVGLPYYAAVGAQEAGGTSIGFSPAVGLREHLRMYRLPISCFDFINFTGLNYVGRDLYLIQSSDAIITVGGRFGSLHELTSALEAHKICGVLIGSGGAADQIRKLVEQLHEFSTAIIYDDDPEQLVKRVIEALDKKNVDIRHQLKTYDEHWFLSHDPKQNHAG